MRPLLLVVLVAACQAAAPTDENLSPEGKQASDVPAANGEEYIKSGDDDGEHVFSADEEGGGHDDDSVDGEVVAPLTDGETDGLDLIGTAHDNYVTDDIGDDAHLGGVSHERDKLTPATFENWVASGVGTKHTVFIRWVASADSAGAKASNEAWAAVKAKYSGAGAKVNGKTMIGVFGDINLAEFKPSAWADHHLDLESVNYDGGCSVWHYNQYTGFAGNYYGASLHHPKGKEIEATCDEVSDLKKLTAYVEHNIEMASNEALWRLHEHESADI